MVYRFNFKKLQWFASTRNSKDRGNLHLVGSFVSSVKLGRVFVAQLPCVLQDGDTVFEYTDMILMTILL